MLNSLRLRSFLAIGGSAIALATAASAADAPAAPPSDNANTVQTLVVTAQRKEEAIQDVPVAVSAFSANTLKNEQITGGADLLRAIPNVNSARGNFGGFNFQVRGIGTKTVGTTADGGIGVHENDMPLIANSLGDSDFLDVERVEVLRGPQGTLFGRNATGGVVNVITAKPVDRYEGSGTIDIGNYNSVKGTGYVNAPFGDTIAARAAFSFLNRDGFATNTYLNQKDDNRNEYQGRLTVSWKPTERFSSSLMYERYAENDHRNRTGKQLCITDPGQTSVGGVPTNATTQNMLSQGCSNGSIYGANAYGSPNTASTLAGLYGIAIGQSFGNQNAGVTTPTDYFKYASATQPMFHSRSDLVQLNARYDVTETIQAIGEIGYGSSNYTTRANYNKWVPSQTFLAGFPFAPWPFPGALPGSIPGVGAPSIGGVVSDPQIGTFNKLTTIDYQNQAARQGTAELRIQSSFKGPLNFLIGANYVNYATQSDYYVLSNGLSVPAEFLDVATGAGIPLDFGPKPNGSGGNYYDNRTFYRLNSYAAFGELYYDLTSNLKLTLGARYSDDRKWDESPTVRLLSASGGVMTQQAVAFKEWTGRVNVKWTPKLDFTNKTEIYAQYSRGYKPGGFNPAQSVGLGVAASFNPEFVNAYEIGTKNTVLDGTMILNLTGFYYDYTGYQISAIVNRNSVNSNIDAKTSGLEVESLWEPVRHLRVNGNLGYLHTEISNGSVVDQLNITGGDPTLTQVKSMRTSNCVAKTADVATTQALINAGAIPAPITAAVFGNPNFAMSCEGIAALTGVYLTNPAFHAALAGLGLSYTGWSIAHASDLVGGTPQNLHGRKLPNSPELTASLGVEYEFRIDDSWRLTPRYDIYYQDKSYSRVFNSVHDQLKAYDVSNLSVLLVNRDWDFNMQFYVKNLFDKRYVQDTYLTDASSGLFTNLFVGDPRTYGVAVTKRF